MTDGDEVDRFQIKSNDATMNASPDSTLEISYLRALLVTTPCMACFAAVIFFTGDPITDPLLLGFTAVMIPVMTFVFAGCLCFMLRCKIGRDGLRPAAPTFYQRVLRWENISSVNGFAKPFYVVRCGMFGGQCLLPRRFLLKHPDALKKLIEQHAPMDNIVRKKLAV